MVPRHHEGGGVTDGTSACVLCFGRRRQMTPSTNRKAHVGHVPKLFVRAETSQSGGDDSYDYVIHGLSCDYGQQVTCAWREQGVLSSLQFVPVRTFRQVSRVDAGYLVSQRLSGHLPLRFAFLAGWEGGAGPTSGCSHPNPVLGFLLGRKLELWSRWRNRGRQKRSDVLSTRSAGSPALPAPMPNEVQQNVAQQPRTLAMDACLNEWMDGWNEQAWENRPKAQNARMFRAACETRFVFQAPQITSLPCTARARGPSSAVSSYRRRICSVNGSSARRSKPANNQRCLRPSFHHPWSRNKTCQGGLAEDGTRQQGFQLSNAMLVPPCRLDILQ
jgi:hypothetical protein